MTDRIIVAIDGPSGSGKSSASRGVARRLGLDYLDTGAMYRALTVAFLGAGLSDTDAAGIADLADLALDIGLDPAQPVVLLGGRDVTAAVRAPEVSAKVSVVAAHPKIRAALIARQRELIANSRRGIVVEGRDITTVVAPQAQVRILLVADPQARLERRQAEHLDQPGTDVRELVIGRDRADLKVNDFESPAEGVELLDSTHLTLDEVVETICRRVAAARGDV